jgi:hypothetical protein
MLHLLDEVLETHLRNTVPLDRAIDVSFAIPDREWSTGLARPTISAYLWDIKRDDKRNVGGVELVNRGTTKMRRLVSPRVRVSYFLSVFTGDQRDEHVLLGRLLQGVMKSREISQEIIPVGLTTPGARIELAIGGGEGNIAREFWSGVDGRYRPGIDLQIILPVDTGLGIEAGPPTTGVDIRTADQRQPTRSSQRVRSFIEEGPQSDKSSTDKSSADESSQVGDSP